jgi:hypothetical protein
MFLGGVKVNLAATGEYIDLYRAADVATRVKNLAAFITNDALSDKAIQEQKNNLNAQIQILKNKEAALFKLLKVKNIEKLNQRLEEYRADTLNLFGQGLHKNFIFPLENDKIKDYGKYEKAIYEVIKDLIKTSEKNFIDKSEGTFGNFVYAIVMSALNAKNSQSNKQIGHFHARHGYDLGSSSTTIEEIINPLYFSEEQKKRLQEIMEEKYNNGNFPAVADFLISKNSNGQSITTWFDYTDRKTSKKAKNLDKTNANQNIKNMIINKNPQAQPLLGTVIDYVLQKQDTAFYVGKNEKEITGILGEIQAIYFLCKLTDSVPGETVQWKGGIIDKSKGKKPHQDIALKSLGIQVKNTTKDLEKQIDMDINFWDLNIHEFLKRLELSESVKEMFLNYFGTYQFNVPYVKKENGSYQKADEAVGAGSEIFNPAREKLEDLQSDIDKLFSVFAASLMYMDIGEDVPKIDANILYILGGTAAITASQILDKIKNSFQTKTPILINSFLKTKETNIVGMLNGGQFFFTKEQKGKTVSENILSNIKLNAKYRFNLADYL